MIGTDMINFFFKRCLIADVLFMIGTDMINFYF
jgi:hypothetical protein